MGALGLAALTHLASAQPERTRQLMAKFQSQRHAHYPPAITAINIASWLLEWLETGGALSPAHFLVDAPGGGSAPAHTLGRFCGLFAELFQRFDEHWAAKSFSCPPVYFISDSLLKIYRAA